MKDLEKLQEVLLPASDVPTFIDPPEGSKRSAKPLAGWMAELLLTGGRKPGADCKCSAPRGSRLKGVSCVHTAGTLVNAMHRAGWNQESTESLIFDTDTFIGTMYLKALDLEGREIFRSWWNDTDMTITTTKPKRQRSVSDSNGLKVSAPTIYRYKVWQKVLGYLESHPGSGVRKYRDALVLLGIGHGIADDYLQRGKELGYIKQVDHGKGRASELFVVAWPDAPTVTRASWHNQTPAQRTFWQLVEGDPLLASLPTSEKIAGVRDGRLLDAVVKIYGTDDERVQLVLRTYTPAAYADAMTARYEVQLAEQALSELEASILAHQRAKDAETDAMMEEIKSWTF